jgi:hypothetical protein
MMDVAISALGAEALRRLVHRHRPPRLSDRRHMLLAALGAFVAMALAAALDQARSSRRAR